MRRGISLLGIVLLLAALTATAARADGTTTTGTTDTTTTDTTTTSTTTTSTSTTQTTTTTSGPSYVPFVRSRLSQNCIGAGVAAIAEPGHATVVLGMQSGSDASAYPSSHPFLTVDSSAASGSSCASGHVTLTTVSLFGGAVTAGSVTATDGKGSAYRVAIDGLPVTAKRGQSIAVGNWGLLEFGAKDGRLSAPLALRLQRTHDSVPSGTTIYLAFAAAAEQTPPGVKPPPVSHHHQPQHRHHTKPPAKPSVPQPLKAVPYLGFKSSHYVFPIDGGASFIDTYGAGRSDIYDGWHHGDDLFAPLGTPVVAVADGTLDFVGWNAIGGWRVWLTDAKGNSFYYAHLAGYARNIFKHRHVKAGQVIGFLGRTGDAFTTAPHVHFEIHPHQFTSLGYDGAVNPTTYLQSWSVEHLKASQIPAAARLQAPAGTPSQEAAVVWGELLKTRHLMPDGEPRVARTPSVRRDLPSEQVKGATYVDARPAASSSLFGDTRRGAGPWATAALGLALAALMAAGSFLVIRRRRSV